MGKEEPSPGLENWQEPDNKSKWTNLIMERNKLLGRSVAGIETITISFVHKPPGSGAEQRSGQVCR